MSEGDGMRVKVHWIESVTNRIEIELPDETTAAERLDAAKQTAAANGKGMISQVRWEADDGTFGGTL